MPNTRTIVTAPARKGDLALIKTITSAVYLKGGTKERVCWKFAKVNGASRDGAVTSTVSPVGSVTVGRPDQCFVASRNEVDVDAMMLDLKTSDLHWQGFDSVSEARSYLQRFRK